MLQLCYNVMTSIAFIDICVTLVAGQNNIKKEEFYF